MWNAFAWSCATCSAPRCLRWKKALPRGRKALRPWNADFADRSSASIATLYDKAHYNREAGIPRGTSYNTTLRELDRRFAAPWLRLISRKPEFDIQNGLAVSRCEQLVVAPNGLEQGVRTLWWRRDETGAFRIVAAQFKDEDLGLAADYLDQVSADVSAVVEKWRKAWEAGRVDDYIDFYANDAVQQGRWGAKNIQRQKESLWQRVKPTLVQISGLRLVADKQGIRADMHDFTYFTPTKVVFGKNAEAQVGSLVKSCHGQRQKGL